MSHVMPRTPPSYMHDFKWATIAKHGGTPIPEFHRTRDDARRCKHNLLADGYVTEVSIYRVEYDKYGPMFREYKK